MVSKRSSTTVIVGEDSIEERNYLQTVLQAEGYEVRLAENGEEVLGLLQDDSSVSLVLLDVRMPVKNGVETLCELRRRHSSLPVIMMSQWPVTESLLKTVEEQKAMLLEKPLLPEGLSIALASGLRLKRGPGQKEPGRQMAQRQGVAPQSYLWKMENLIRQVGSADIPVLLQGETGAGKEILARQIHACSPRAKKPFVKINCAALPSELVESELFGYERGAFSGAYVQSQGLFETAHEGSILLDEIGDMDVRLQAKLLQVLQDGEFRRLGGRELIRVDVRVMAATHQNLRQAIKAGQFREDLYYRLNVGNIRIPPLRECCEQILPLAEHFLHKHGPPDCPMPSIPLALRDAMLRHDWPGNVRELENTMRRYLVFRDPVGLAEELKGEDPINRPAEQTDRLIPTRAPAGDGDAYHASPLARVEQAKRAAETEALLAALEATHWNRKKAAQSLDIDYKALLYKMKKLGIGTGRREQGQPHAVEDRKAHPIPATG